MLGRGVVVFGEALKRDVQCGKRFYGLSSEVQEDIYISRVGKRKGKTVKYRLLDR